MVRLDSAQRRQQLLSAARVTFLESGLNGTTVRDIAAEAEVNEALIYRHFASKQELFEAAIVEPLVALMRELQAEARSLPVGTQTELIAFTKKFYRSLLLTFTESVDLFGVVLFGDQSAGRHFYSAHLVPFIDSVSETVRSNLDSWSHQNFDPAAVTTMGFGMCWGLAMDSYFRKSEIDIEAAVESITDVIFNGLLARLE